MAEHKKLDKIIGLDSVQLTNAVDEDLFALISSLIDQNAELMKKMEELNSQKELANSLSTAEHQQEKTINLCVEREASDRALAIVKEAETCAAMEVDRIIAKAKIEADRILTEANQKAEEIIEQKKQFAIQQGLQIINKAEERALALLKDVQKQAEAITGNSNHQVRR